MDLKNKNALITGAARKGRLGRAIALALAQKGCNIFIHYGRSEEEADSLIEELRAMDVQIAKGSADLSHPISITNLIEKAVDELGPIHVLVNSASGFPKDSLSDISLDRLQDTANLTLFSPVLLTQAFAKHLSANEEGAVINIVDWRVNGKPYIDRLSYSLAKSGLETFTKISAKELAPNIRVNAIALGAILPPPEEGEKYLKKLTAKIPLKRAGGEEAVTKGVLSLIENHFITGEILRLDGGAHLV